MVSSSALAPKWRGLLARAAVAAGTGAVRSRLARICAETFANELVSSARQSLPEFHLGIGVRLWTNGAVSSQARGWYKPGSAISPCGPCRGQTLGIHFAEIAKHIGFHLDHGRVWCVHLHQLLRISFTRSYSSAHAVKFDPGDGLIHHYNSANKTENSPCGSDAL
jgi:hypothetical protein